ncbi:MAG: hypothetical protein L3K04_05335 [Thermoplasmata archaeon]|nr:hypothetical protein [Thermoplasmata archaeon]MCI4337852.1 hypothetical protein [Thermoplasmata archaeon]
MSPPRFVGRDSSPVLDKYPPKDPSLTLRALPPPIPSPARPAPAGTKAPPVAGAALSSPVVAPPGGGTLLNLEKPFDPDEFAQQLGETRIQVEVPRDALAEVLRRIADFMGFGIYVYEIRVAPLPGEQLKAFRLDLTRVDYSAGERRWNPFEERGRSETPFGPGGAPGRRV